MLRKQAGLCKDVKIISHSDRRETLSGVVSPTMSTNYLQSGFKKVKTEVMRCHDNRNVWIREGDWNKVFYECFLKLYFRKTATIQRL